MASLNMHKVIAIVGMVFSKLPTLSYIATFVLYLQLANSWPELDIKVLVGYIAMYVASYSQITAASDWHCLFAP